MEFFKHKKLREALVEQKQTHFRQWKAGKHWIYGASILLALAGTAAVVVPTLISPQNAYAVTNGNIVLYNGIITNTGAVETGNPEGRVFCIDAGTSLDTGATSNLSDTGSGAAGATWASLNGTQRFQIQALGWLAFNNSKSSANSDNNMYLAAQELIWDITTGHSLPASAAESHYGPSMMDVPDDQAWYEGTPNYDAATMSADMDYLLTQYKNFLLTPKFDSDNETIHLGETATFIDTNNALGAYSKIIATNGLKTSVSGNKLTVTPTQAGTGTITLSNGGVSETDGTANSGGVHVWFTNNPDGTAGQNLIYSAEDPEQKVQVSVKVIPSAALKITKLDTDTKKPIAGAIFEGLNKEGQVVTKDADGKDLPDGGKFTTGSDGTLTVDNLMNDPENKVSGEADTIVTLREVSVPAPYTLSNNLATVIGSDGKVKPATTDLPVSLVSGTTSKNPTGATFSDKVQVQAIKVQKTATIGGKEVSDFPNGVYSLKDAAFTIKDTTKGTTLGVIWTDDKGVADLSVLAQKGDGHQSTTQYQALLNQMLTNGDTYSVEETAAPNGLACDWNGGKPQTFKLNASGDDTQLINPSVQDTTNKNTDTPITVTSTLTKVDADTKNDKTQGSGLLAGTIETLFYRVVVKDASGKVIHKANTPVAWADGFSEKPIAATSGKKVDETTVSLQVTRDKNSVGVENLPLTATTSQAGYYWAETDVKGKLTPGYGYTDNTATFDVQSGEGVDGTGSTSGTTVVKGNDTDLTQADHVLTVGLEFTKALGDNGSLTGENGATFKITPADETTKAVMNGVESQNDTANSGDAAGFDGFTVAGLTKFKFPIGSWKIQQTVVPDGTKPVQDMLVSFTPEPAADGAPKSYTLTVKWADGLTIYTKTFQADDFTNGNNNLVNVNLGTLTDNKLTPPSIETKAADGSDEDQTLGVGTVKGKDDSTIKDLVAGDYTEVTHWVDSSTGAAVVVDGQPVTASQDFSSKGTGKDSVTTEVSFNDADLQGKKITAEEFVYPKGKTSGTPVVSETDYKNNPSQTLTVGTAKGSTQVNSASVKMGAVKVPDKYSGTGFAAGQKVLVKVDSLFDHTLNNEVPATGEATFTADKDGKVSGVVEVSVDTSALQGHELTFFESTYVDDKLVFQLHDKTAKSETVTVASPQPHKFDLKASDKSVMDNSLLSDDKEIAKDFALTGDGKLPTTLERGDTFLQEVANTAKNPAVDKADNNQAQNNNTLNVTLGQTYDFELWLNTTAYDDSAEEQAIGMTEYLDTSNLTTDLPKWTVTGATDGKVLDKSLYTLIEGKAGKDGKTPITLTLNATKEVKNAAGQTVKIVDTSKVKLGQIYKINLPVTVKSSAKPNTEITNTAEQFGTDLNGKTWSQNTETRQNQVVTPSGNTQVEQKVVNPTKDAAYTDDYLAKNLTVGATYTVKVPNLWDASSQKLISVTGSITFKATAKEMTVKVPVKFDASSLGGHDLVTFEDLYLQDATTKEQVLVYQMHDKNAASETVHVNLPTNTPSVPRNITNSTVNALADTGLSFGRSLFIGLSLMTGALIGGLVLWVRRRKVERLEN